MLEKTMIKTLANIIKAEIFVLNFGIKRECALGRENLNFA